MRIAEPEVRIHSPPAVSPCKPAHRAARIPKQSGPDRLRRAEQSLRSDSRRSAFFALSIAPILHPLCHPSRGGLRVNGGRNLRSAVHPQRCFAASLMAVANAAAPPKITVKTGFSLSTIRAQTKDMGRIMRGLSRNEPTKINETTNLNKLGNIDNKDRAKKSTCIFSCRRIFIFCSRNANFTQFNVSTPVKYHFNIEKSYCNSGRNNNIIIALVLPVIGIQNIIIK